MSLFDSVVGGLTGGNNGGLLELAGQLLQKVGGIQGLEKLLSSSGLGAQVSSWIGGGDNQGISGAQLGQALQSGGLGEWVDQAAQKLGLSTDDVHNGLAQLLPQVVSHLTPDGQAPAGDGGDLDLSSLAGMAGKLFG